jgi:hypothetical protein
MPKYKVHMTMGCVKCAEFVMQADDPDQLHNIIGEMDSGYIEENLEWTIVDVDYPTIENFERVSKDTPVHPAIQKEGKQILKAWEAL